MTLSLNDITQLVHQLVYDERLEEMSPGRYRSVRRVDNRNILEDQFGPLDPDMDGIGPREWFDSGTVRKVSSGVGLQNRRKDQPRQMRIYG